MSKIYDEHRKNVDNYLKKNNGKEPEEIPVFLDDDIIYFISKAYCEGYIDGTKTGIGKALIIKNPI